MQIITIAAASAVLIALIVPLDALVSWFRLGLLPAHAGGRRVPVMAAQGAKRQGRRQEKRWMCGRSRGGEVRAGRRAIETRERQQAQREIDEQMENDDD